VIDKIRRLLDADSRVAYAMLFGSQARGTAHAHSDVDIAVGFRPPGQLDALELGTLIADLESAAGRPVHLVALEHAPPALAYRIFRDGQRLVVHDEPAFKARVARAILEYLDFKPVEDLFTRHILRASHGR
jgi:predicted nucleotidyltransferase